MINIIQGRELFLPAGIIGVLPLSKNEAEFMRSDRDSGDLAEQVRAYMKCHRMMDGVQRLVIAISGGPDSTALITLLSRLAAELRLDLAAVHVNHGLRGGESDLDQQFCEELADRLSIPLHVASSPGAEIPRSNVEEKMREVRLEEFDRFLSDPTCRVAVGHTRTDQAETFLLRLFRGAGLAGLSCMEPVSRRGIVRPLLNIERADVLAFLAREKIVFRSDRSNEDLRFRRNRIRHRVMPVLCEEFHPSVPDVLARTADVLRRERDALQAAAGYMVNKIVSFGDEELQFSVGDWRAVPQELHLNLLREMIRRLSGSLRRLELKHYLELALFIEQAASGRSMSIPGPVYIMKSCGRVRFCLRKYQPVSYCCHLTVPGDLFVPQTGEFFQARLEGVPDGSLNQVRLPRRKGTLTVRGPREGDTMVTGKGTKSVRRLLQDHRIPLFLRDKCTLLVAENEEILWIPLIGQKMCYNTGADSAEMIIERRIK